MLFFFSIHEYISANQNLNDLKQDEILICVNRIDRYTIRMISSH